MQFKGSGPILFVLLAMVFIVGTYAADYPSFLSHHYDNPRSNVGKRYCNTMMQRRGMTKPQCKAVNSFIHGSKKQIIAVCSKGGKPYGNGLRRSNKQFSVTTCKLSGGSPRPPCNYRENRSNRFIVVACRGGKPVHFDEGQI
ncbi:angiogenin-2-like isoform X1 [Sceloporus undulatus]|uniref:angiogenin-2-like isoform X1 n=1 Tax=Sceloporus undulatus TaxID=8520 RepID=UPI001C4C16BD|nr:angiogenin-2-like isoform X1 [Sceloporus undulatus]